MDNERTGIIIPPRNEIALAEAIIKILTNKKLRNRMGIEAFNFAMSEMSWKKIGSKMISIYNKVLQS